MNKVKEGQIYYIQPITEVKMYYCYIYEVNEPKSYSKAVGISAMDDRIIFKTFSNSKLNNLKPKKIRSNLAKIYIKAFFY